MPNNPQSLVMLDHLLAKVRPARRRWLYLLGATMSVNAGIALAGNGHSAEVFLSGFGCGLFIMRAERAERAQAPSEVAE